MSRRNWGILAFGILVLGFVAHIADHHGEFAVLMLLAYTIYRDQVQWGHE